MKWCPRKGWCGVLSKGGICSVIAKSGKCPRQGWDSVLGRGGLVPYAGWGV
jgi:hypothetical protein